MTRQHSRQPDSANGRRRLIHDLRNLFGVVASAKHMLDERPSEDRRHSLLAAIEQAALRGGQLTTDLLVERDDTAAPKLLDVSNLVLALAPLARAMAGARAEVSFDLCRHPVVARICPKLFEAALLELIANAGAALSGHGHIHVRTRRVGTRLHVIVADDGKGMSSETLRRALSHPGSAGAKGTGLGRVREFAAMAHGRLRLRSRIGRGTVVSLNLPMVLQVALDEPASPPTRRSNPRKKGARP